MFENYQQKKIDELIQLYQININNLKEISINKTIEYILNRPDDFYIISHSGGKDSTVMDSVWKNVLEILATQHLDIYNKLNWTYSFSNTTNETLDTYKYIKNELPQNKLNILNPKIGFYQWIKNVKNYYLPSVTVRNCCSTYKEGQLNKHYDKNASITTVIGVRKFESKKRTKYDYIMDNDFYMSVLGKNGIPKKWITFAPIVEWHDEEVWLYILKEELNYNHQYNLGFNRCGCLICPYQHDYIDLLIEEYYPNHWRRWMDIVEKNYEICHIENNFKWTLEEWQQGKWKASRSREFEIINSKPTKEKINELAELKGISKEMAKKYFNKKCKCGKKMNPSELAMFYKTFGRYENIEDNRELMCKKCFCESQGVNAKEYRKLVLEYTDSGCNLF